MTEKKLVLGIPTGSLVKDTRSDLARILMDANLIADRVTEDAPTKMSYIPWIQVVRGRPQEMPSYCADGVIDAFFGGDDWALEWNLAGKPTERLVGLDTGKVRIVAAAGENYDAGSPLVRIGTEYVNIARNFAAERYGVPLEEVLMLPKGSLYTGERGIVVIDSAGATESKAYEGWVDMVVEATQSGSALRSWGLKESREIMRSECAMYANPESLKDTWKKEKLENITVVLGGVVAAKDIVMLKFNMPTDKTQSVVDYLTEQGLCNTQPTVTPTANGYNAIEVQVRTNDPNNPLVDVQGAIYGMGGRGIDKQPVNCSIQGR